MRKLSPTAFSLVIALTLVTCGAGTVVAQSTIWVDTFRNEFINWATPHANTFTFPESQLYEQVLCHISLACPAAPGDCDPWDRFGSLSLRRADSDTTHTDLEMARFVTPYDITFPGGPQTCAWVVDVSDYQFLLHGEVELVLFIESWIGGDRGWLMSIRFEMIPGEPEREAFAIQQLWRTGYLKYGDPDDPAADHLPPQALPVPAEATWARFRAFSTGHGFLNTDNAAEFSYKWQGVTVDGSGVQHHLWRPDCEDNPCSPQLGTWQYDRAGWCPGDKAEAWNVDISDLVTPGETAEVAFDLQPYVNWCRPNNPDCVDTPSCECPGHAFYEFEGQVIFYRQPSATDVGDGRLVPGRLHLVGNHPNPFNPSTAISYHLAVPAAVDIAVYDAEGALVRQDHLEHAAGTHTWTWNGRDEGGHLLPAGVYLYEVRSGAERVSAKMLMLK